MNTKKNILLIDDDESVTQMLTMLLETRGYTVNVAHSGQGAINQADDMTDLIILDLILPDQGGFEVCQKLKGNQRTRHIPIIFLSAKLLHEDIIKGLYLGADDYLTKPFDYEELVARMEVIMRRTSMFSNGTEVSPREQSVICELRKIIDNKCIVPVFQPIFLLNPFKIFGFEALSRPQTESKLVNPEILFRSAIQYGCYPDLEALAWEKALQYLSSRITDEKLFFNCNPYLVEEKKFLEVKSLFNKYDIKVENVILEITERSAISDFKTFYNHLSIYREHGFKFAVDDVGGGYASLESIVETRPEVVKIDQHIVQDIHLDHFKRSIVKFIVTFCKENHILCIAEGVETKKDFDVIKELEVDACQGYYLYKPSAQIDFEEINRVSTQLEFAS